MATLFTGYAGYYICRSNLSVVTPLLLQEFGSNGLTKAAIGGVASTGVLLYALGKISNGVLADYLGGRRLFLFGIFASTLCTVAFGLASGLLLFTLIWAANRYVQSMGWGALVKIAARWYPVHRHATVMGFLSMSYLLGDAFARWYLGGFINGGVGWRGLFFIAAGTFAAIGLIASLTLKQSPREVGGEEPGVNPRNVFGSEGDSLHPGSLRTLLGPLARSPLFWCVCAMNVGLTLIRETFNFWTPTYLTEAAGMSAGIAAQSSLFFPLVGAISSAVAGRVSDYLNGRHGRVMLPAMALLITALVFLAVTPGKIGGTTALALIGLVALGLLAPYSFLSGVIALDLGGKRGASTASGLIDSAGYMGAVLSGFGVGAAAERWGWPVAFGLLAVVAVLTGLAAIAYWVLDERSAK